MIVREIPAIGEKSAGELAGISATSCRALGATGHDRVQWLESFVAADRTFCVYLAADEDAIRAHAAKVCLVC